MVKKFLSIVLSLIIALSCMVVVNVTVSAATTPADVSDSVVKSRFDTLRNKLVGKYFTCNQTYCNPAPGKSGHGCSNCLNGNVIAKSWLKNAIGLVPNSISLVPRHYCPGGSEYITPSAYSCAGFANFVEWYLYAQKSTDDVYVDYLGTVTMSYNGLRSVKAKVGNVLRTSTHSVVLYSYDSSNVSYIQCNGTRNSDGNCKVTFYTCSYSTFTNAFGSSVAVTQARNATTATHSHSYTTGYDSAHPHKQYKICDCGYSYYTGNTRTVSSCSQCNPTYTVRYYANGGSGAPASSSHRNGNTHTVSSTIPVRFGYTFKGWSTSSSATSATYTPGSTFKVTGNKSLYAVWGTAVEVQNGYATVSKTATILEEEHCVYYTITPDKTRKYRIESTGNIDSKVAIYNSSGTELASNDDGADNYQFRLDYTFSAGTKYYIKVFAYGSSTGAIPFSVKKFYKITYNANGGSGAPSSQERMAGETVSLRTTTPTRSGYRFLGWGTSSTATSVSYNAGSSYSANNDVTLYAVWSRNATPPATPVVSSAINTLSGVKVSWNSVSGASRYVVYRRCGGSSTWYQVGTTTGTSIEDRGVSEGIYYIYSVRAYNNSGLHSAYDRSKTRTIQHIIAPYTYTRNRATEFSWVKISWDSVPGATKYAVYRRSAGQSTWVLVGYTTDLYLDDYGTKSNYYCYSVRAYNGTGYSAYDSSKTSVIKSWGTYA